jgi:ABC-2 type transport system permease protein
MNKTLKIAQREYEVSVRRKAFIISALLTPVFIAGFAILPGILAKRTMTGEGETRRIAVVDLTGQLYSELEKAFGQKGGGGAVYIVEGVAASPENLDEKRKELNERINRRQLNAYIVIGKKVLTSHVRYEDTDDHKIRYYSGNAADIGLMERVTGVVRQVVINARLKNEGIDPAITAKASWNINIEGMQVKKGEEKKSQGITHFFGAFAFMMLLFFALQMTGQMLMQGVIEEKNTRVMEVLLSSVSPKELMIGKILGLGAVGLTIVTIWSVVGYSAARLRNIDIASLPNVGFFVLYFLLGYALFAVLMSAVGSVCNSEKEAQQLMMPVMLLLVIPLMVWFNVVQRPDGSMAKVLSLLPFSSPMTMMLRIAVRMPPAKEILVSIAILIASIGLAVCAGVKVFRTGILMYGKRPSLKEIFRWVKYK